MNEATRIPHPHLNLFELRNGKGKAVVSQFGAQVLQWQVDGNDIYFRNAALIDDKSKPLREGAPVCFPWFNKGLNWQLGRELAPSHGPVRSSQWELLEATSISIKFKTVCHSHLNLALEISVEYVLTETTISSRFSVLNLAAGKNSFELALHTYFSAKIPQTTEIAGLKDVPAKAFRPELPIDRIFENSGMELKARFDEYVLTITNSNFSKSVVWHPGYEHQVADLPQVPSPNPFLCLESLTETLHLEAGERWSGSVSYSFTD